MGQSQSNNCCSCTSEKCSKFARYMALDFNMLTICAGLAMIVVGAIMQSRSQWGPLGDAIYLIIVGIILFLVSYFGCYSTVKEKRTHLIAYGVVMILLTVMCLIAAIVALVLCIQAAGFAHSILAADIQKYDTSEPVRHYMDNLQKDNNCCGSTNYTSWFRNAAFARNYSVPSSCCIWNVTKTHFQCGKDALILPHPAFIHTKGCQDVVSGEITTIYTAVLYTAGIAADICISSIIFSFCLAKYIGKREYEEMKS